MYISFTKHIFSYLIIWYWHFYRNKKEPVWSQQFLIKGDCDSETGFEYTPCSLTKVSETGLHLSEVNNFLQEEIVISRQVYLTALPLYTLYITFFCKLLYSILYSILFSFCLSIDNVLFNNSSIVRLFRIFSLMILLFSKGLTTFT